MKCIVENCKSKYNCRGYCNRHYLQFRKYGKIVPGYDKRPAIIKDEVAFIPLGGQQKNKFAMVDIQDAWVDKYLWQCHHKGYARGLVDGKNMAIHRLLLSPETSEVQVDHINGDKLDNRTGYKGVVEWEGGYKAQLMYLGKRFQLGIYHIPEEAARAYDQKAMELHGEFAHLNLNGKTG